MPTGKQVRAARMLAEWDAEDLAKRTGLTSETVFKIERETTNPRPATIDKIIQAFSSVGVEFIGNLGVTKRDDQIVTLSGSDVYTRLLDDVFHTLHRQENPEALFFFVDNSKSPPEVVASHRRIRNAGIRCRYLCQEHPKRMDFPAEDYRGIPEGFFHNNSAIIYGDKYATMLLDPVAGEDQGAIILRNSHIAAAQRNLFELIWASAQKVKI